MPCYLLPSLRSTHAIQTAVCSRNRAEFAKKAVQLDYQSAFRPPPCLRPGLGCAEAQRGLGFKVTVDRSANH